jgi:GGDEF domain-containing protein
LISIRKAAEDLDRIDTITRTLTSVYEHAIWSAAQYAIEIDPQTVIAFREHLTALRDRISQARSAEDWQSLQAAFRGELREFRDKSTEQLGRMRNEFAAAVTAMQSFADSVVSSGEDHTGDLRTVLSDLGNAAQTDNIDEVRSVIRKATATIGASVERLRKSHQIVVAQLRDEIRLLQDQVEVERHAAQVDQATGTWNRQKMESSIATHTDKDDAFSLLILCVRNLRRLDGQYSRQTMDKVLRAMTQRLAAMLADSAIIGRWDEETFTAILPVDPTAAIRTSREAAMKLSGNYSVQEDGVARQISLVIVTGVVDHDAGTGHATFAQHLDQMFRALNVA